MRACFRTLSIALLFALSATVGVSVAAPASAGTYLTEEENKMLAMVNDYRAQHGLHALTVNAALQGVARRHTSRMAAEEHLYHNPNLARDADEAIPGWRLIAENVGVGPTTEAVQEAFYKSSKHKANILKSNVNIIGIGAVRAAGGQLYFTQNFADWTPQPTPAPATPKPQPTAEPVAPAPATPTAAQESRARRAESAPQRPAEPSRAQETQETEAVEESTEPAPDTTPNSSDGDGDGSEGPSFLETLLLLMTRLVSRLAFWA